MKLVNWLVFFALVTTAASYNRKKKRDKTSYRRSHRHSKRSANDKFSRLLADSKKASIKSSKNVEILDIASVPSTLPLPPTPTSSSSPSPLTDNDSNNLAMMDSAASSTPSSPPPLMAHNHGAMMDDSAQASPAIPYPPFATSSVSFASCTTALSSTRKEFRDMTADEWQTFKRAVYTMHSTPSTANPLLSEYDAWAKIHLDNTNFAHGSPHFFPWHRAFLVNFEQALRKFEPDVTIPYWDWGYDAANPLGSPIFTQNYLYFIPNNPSGDCSWHVAYPSPHCLIREYDQSDFTAFYSTKALLAAMLHSNNDYDTYRSLIEQAPHGIVHLAIGGNDGDMTGMQSPNDPIFWLHHAFIDKLWSDWQSIGTNKQRYDGSFNGVPVKITDVMTPFDITVSQLLDLSKLCVQYQQFSAQLDTAAAVSGAISAAGISPSISPAIAADSATVLPADASIPTTTVSSSTTDNTDVNTADIGSTAFTSAPPPSVPITATTTTAAAVIIVTPTSTSPSTSPIIATTTITTTATSSPSPPPTVTVTSFRRPIPLPSVFVALHGMNLTQVREQENQLNAWGDPSQPIDFNSKNGQGASSWRHPPKSRIYLQIFVTLILTIVVFF